MCITIFIFVSHGPQELFAGNGKNHFRRGITLVFCIFILGFCFHDTFLISKYGMETCLLKVFVIVFEGSSDHPNTRACEENVCTLLSLLGIVLRKGKWNENNKLTRCHKLFPDYCLIHAFTVSGNYATGLTALALGRENSQRRRAFWLSSSERDCPVQWEVHTLL